MDTPGFAMTHQFGQPFGGFPEDADEARDDWAGTGFIRRLAPEELEPVPGAA